MSSGALQLPGPSHRMVLFGDTVGLPQLLEVVGTRDVASIVGAAIRPEQHEALAALATRYDTRFLVQPRAGDPAYGPFLRTLQELAPDLFVVNSYSMILRPDLLAVPRHGAINVHGALLPAYRGANPTEWALINGERETGVTIHVVDAGIDTGPIIAQRVVSIDFEDTWIDVRKRIAAATGALLHEIMPQVLAGRATAWPQEEARARYWKRRNASDGVLGWDLPAVSIYNRVRALVAPHPGVRADGQTIDSWQSLPEIVWRKFKAGGRWSTGGVGLIPHRPTPAPTRRQANAVLAFDICTDAGVRIGSVRLFDVGERGGPVRASIERECDSTTGGLAANLRALVARFVTDELNREVAFTSIDA